MNPYTMQAGNVVASVLRTHPQQTALDQDKLSQAMLALAACAGACTFCADACLSEKMVAELVRCIRLNQDCATICAATASVLVRGAAEPLPAVLRPQLEACTAACAACGEECARHAQMHEHCRICAEACRHCEETCRQLLRSL
jgi:sugar phosphate isomerase/epimerase